MDNTQITTDIDNILDSISDGLFTIDNDFKITSFNTSAERITGVSRDQAIGQKCCEVFKASICENDCAMKQTFSSQEPVVNKTIFIIDLQGNRIPVSISTAVLKDNKGNIIGGVETFRDLTQIESLKKELLEKYTVYDIVSKNSRIKDIFRTLPDIAESDSNVLITGPNGSGKELFARAIHTLSNRSDGPFVAVNLSALPDSLLESELFGYKKGAFTGASQDKAGRLATAAGGTLFIDEIGDISPSFQIKLLRVIQEKAFEPLGGVATVKADVRFLFATNKDLFELVQNNEFREDLYYRIHVISIDLPPLSNRLEDIPLLIEHFIKHYNDIHNKNILGIDEDALAVLLRHTYPGNVRELRNIIEHAFVLCKEGFIGCIHLPAYIQKYNTHETIQVGRSLEEIEKETIKATLQRNNNRKDITAGILGIDTSTLWRKMKKYKL
jgi:PAS domain S-box-containing protein